MTEQAERPLTIRQARRIARGRVRVEPDEIDAALWRISKPANPLCAEVHEPMTREQLRAFIAEWTGR